MKGNDMLSETTWDFAAAGWVAVPAPLPDVFTIPNIFTSTDASLAHSYQFADGSNNVVTSVSLTGSTFTQSTTVTFDGVDYVLGAV